MAIASCVWYIVCCLYILQTHQIQYDTCNAAAGTGMFDYNGFCLPGGTLRLTLTKNSQDLMNTVNFVDNSVYYLTST